MVQVLPAAVTCSLCIACSYDLHRNNMQDMTENFTRASQFKRKEKPQSDCGLSFQLYFKR